LEYFVIFVVAALVFTAQIFCYKLLLSRNSCRSSFVSVLTYTLHCLLELLYGHVFDIRKMLQIYIADVRL